MNNWLVRFGLWLAGKGGWAPPVPDHRACIEELRDLREDAIQAGKDLQAAEARAILSGAGREAFEEAYRRGETARQRAETALQEAIATREQATGALRAYTAPDLAPALFHRAKELVALQAGNHGVSGEAKRHQVYAKLRKEFPSDPHKDIGLAIELAVRV